MDSMIKRCTHEFKCHSLLYFAMATMAEPLMCVTDRNFSPPEASCFILPSTTDLLE